MADARSASLPVADLAADLAVCDRLQTPVWAFDLDCYAMRWANRAAVALWGAPDRETLLARDFASDLSEATRNRLRAYREQFLRGETAAEEWTFYPEGRATVVRCRCSGLWAMVPAAGNSAAGGDGGEPRLLMLVEGTLERDDRLDGAALRATEALRHTGLVVSVYDPEGRPLLRNPAALQCYGSSPAIADCGPDRAFLAQFVDRATGERVLAAVQQGQRLALNARVRTQRGERWHHLDLRPLHDPITGNPSAIATEEDITHRQEVERSLACRERFWAALVALQQRLLAIDRAEEAHQAIVMLLGQAARASRAYLFENHRDRDGRFLTSQRAEWSGPGVPPQIDNAELQNIPYEPALQRWAELLGNDQLVTGRVADFPPSERAILEPQGIRSILVLPLQVNRQFWGFVGFDNCEDDRPWEFSEVDLLWAAAGAIALAEERRQARCALRASEARLSQILDNAGAAIASFRLYPDGNWEPEYFSRGTAGLLGASPETLRDDRARLRSRLVAGATAAELDRVRSSLLQGRSTSLEWSAPVGGDRPRCLACTLTSHWDPQADCWIVTAVGTDISDRKRVEAQLQHDAQHDALTGLPNRTTFARALDAAIARTRKDPAYRFAVLFADIDRFKLVNDTLGHGAGDDLLVAFARRLQGAVREGDLVARQSGDEFAVLLAAIAGPTEARAIADRVRDSLRAPFNLAGREVRIGASIGISTSTEGTADPSEMLRRADAAMYRAKRQSHHAVLAGPEEASDRLTLETALRRALDRADRDDPDEYRLAGCELTLHYQPIVDLTSRQPVGVEALLRWAHPELGAVSPAEFVPLAETTGLIVPLGERVLRQACWQLQQWRSRLPEDFALTVHANLSARQFLQTDLMARIDRALRDANLDGRWLTLEVTESAVVENPEEARVLLEALQARGIELAIDDFGTGYSSLSCLHQFPLQALKLDRAFAVGAMGRDSGASSEEIPRERRVAETIRAIAALGRALEATVVAEGIETPQQARRLAALGCDRGQGYVFARPMPPDEALAWLQRHRPNGRGPGPALPLKQPPHGRSRLPLS